MSKFRVMNPKIFIQSVSVRLIFQISVQIKDVLFQVFLKLQNIRLAPLATPEFIPRQKQILWVSNL